LGYLYGEGRGVPQDFTKAAEWFSRAAEQGDAVGQASLGWLYYSGHGVARDYGKAAELFGKAAAQGFAMAEGNLGYLYERGQGVRLDYLEAYKWYQLAAAHGYGPATRAIKSLSEIMTQEQLQKARARASILMQGGRTTEVSKTSLDSLEIHN